jgi:hypothetical protein
MILARRPEGAAPFEVPERLAQAWRVRRGRWDRFAWHLGPR